MTSRAFHVVEMFEEAMAEFAGSKYGVAVDSCSTAIFLSLLHTGVSNQRVSTPARTYISVPNAIMRAGGIVGFTEEMWTGAYRLHPTGVVDSALRMQAGMYAIAQSWIKVPALYCVSFHMRKHIKIGRGGMVLTDDDKAVEWLQRMRFDGRNGSVPFTKDTGIKEHGFNAYMLPEQAARGLQLLEAHDPKAPDLTPVYPDLSKLPNLSW